jgi:hypothetical protein
MTIASPLAQALREFLFTGIIDGSIGISLPPVRLALAIITSRIRTLDC